MKRTMVIAASLLALLVVTACRDSDEDVQADACTELSELQQSVAALEALGPTSTTEQWQEAADAVRENAQDAAQSVRRVEDARYEELADAYHDLEEAVRNVDDDDTIVQARAQLQPYLQAVAEARQNLFASLNCQ
jgi:hypothetical protein